MTTQNRNLRIIFIVSICFVLLLTIFSYTKINALIQSAALVNHTSRVTLELEKTIGTLKDAETAHRGYLLTHDKRFLEPFNKGLKEYAPHIETLKELIKDNPDQQKKLQQVETLTRHRKERMLSILELDKLRKPAAEEMLNGKLIMDSLRTEVNSMIAHENNLIKERNNKLSRQMIITPALLLFLNLIALTILIVSYWQLNKSLLKTQRLQAEVINKNSQLEKNKQIEASQKELQYLLKQSPVAITLLKGKNLLLEVANETALQLMGKTEQEIINKSLNEIFPELTERQNIYKAVYDTGIPYQGKGVEVKFKRYGENYTGYYDLNYLPWYDSEGKIKGVMGVGVDVSENVRARKKIEESERLYEAITQNTPDLIYVFDLNYRFTYANDALLKMWGSTWDAAIGKNLLENGYELWHAEMHEREIDQVIATKKSVRGEVSFPHATLGKRIYDYIFVPVIDQDGNVEAIAGTTRDITLQVEAREKIAESEKRYNHLIHSSPSAIGILYGEDLKITVANEPIIEIWGKGKDIIGKPYFEVLPELVEQGYRQVFAEVYKTGKPFHAVETPVQILQEGKLVLKYYNFLLYPQRNAANEIEGIGIIATEVTTKAILNNQIKESEKRFRVMVEQAPVAICVLRGKNFVVEVVNTKQLELWGKTKEKVLNMPIFEAIPEGAGQGFEELLAGVLTTGKPFIATELPTTLIRNGRKETFYSNFVYEPLYSGWEIDGIISIATDVTEHVMARNKILESEQRYRSLADNIPMISFIIEPNAEATISYWNKTWLDYTGQTHEQALGRAWDGIIHPDDVQGVLDIYVPAFQKRQSYFIPAIRVKRHDGEYRWHLFTANPRYLSDGEFMGYIGVGFDIHHQKIAEDVLKESEQRFRSLAQTLPQLVWVTDAQGYSEFASFSWKDYSGIEPGGEQEWKAIVHPEDYDAINAAWAHSLATGSLYNFDVRLKRKDGEYKWHTVKGQPVFNNENKIVKWVGAFTDIHDQRIKDEKKDEFISIASHEMKTPLTTAKGYLQMLELSLQGENEIAFQFAKKASQSVSRLNELIGELLDVSKIRLGKLDYTITTFNFNDLIESTVEDMQLSTVSHTIIKSGNVLDAVTGDKERLQQVLINLLNNGIKYSPGSSKVFITVQQDEDVIKVAVKDTGIGIAKENLHKIFERYHRIEDHAAHFQGLGIGLFISYEIIQHHHGKLWVESEPEKGSTFYFIIPVQ